MNRSDRWMRRLFGLLLIVAIGGSISWIPLALAPDALDAAPDGTPGQPTAETPTAEPTAEAPAGAPEGPAATGRPIMWDNATMLPAATGYVWPLVGAKITTYFAPTSGGSMVLAGQTIHNGLDLARPCWTPVRAAHDATVLYAGRRADPYLGFSGPVQRYYDELARRKLSDRVLPITVVTDDGNGLLGVYTHLARAVVEAGASVAAGDTIGYEGATGNATGCHLHYSLIVAAGPWVEVAPLLVEKWRYPRYMRLRVDPLLYLPLGSRDAAVPVAGLTAPAERPQYVGLVPLPPLPRISSE